MPQHYDVIIVGSGAGGDVLLRRRAPRLEPEPALRWPGRDIGLTGRESELLALLPSGLTNRRNSATVTWCSSIENGSTVTSRTGRSSS